MLQDGRNPKGELEIYKKFSDGTSEMVYSDHNVITSGMGVCWGLFFAGSGSTVISDFQIRYFQVGTGGSSVISTYDKSQVELVSRLTAAEYGGVSPILISNHRRLIPHTLSVQLQDFIYIPDSLIKRSGVNSVTYILTLDENTANGNILNEIGLYVDNPRAQSPKQSILVAYKPFTDIPKTEEFSLVFKWTITI